MTAQAKLKSYSLTFVFVVIIPCLPLLISGRRGWLEAWIYAAVCILGFAISRALAVRRYPDLLSVRVHSLKHENTAAWDKRLAPLAVLGSGLVPLAAGLEALAGQAVNFGMPVKIIALAVMLAGYTLGAAALMAYCFFLGTVRIQAERGHRVVSSGPYRWVRHPGYAGGALGSLVVPFFLDSVWAFLPAAAAIPVLVVHTKREDSYPQNELEGYREYALAVRWRLLPGVW